MRVSIAGAHGQIAQRLIPLLTAQGDTVTGLIRNVDHAADVRSWGADPRTCDLEQSGADELVAAISGSNAVVFAAGAGPGSGGARKLTMDRDGAIKLLDAARAANVPGYVMISSIGTANPPGGDDVFSIYLRAKAQADAALTASDREWTVVRPGALTNEPGTGHVRIDLDEFRGRVSRDDVAGVIDAVLHEPRARRRILYVNGGELPIDQALAAVLD